MSGHRDVRAADLGGLRAGPGAPGDRRCRCGWPIGRCGRSTRCSTSSRALLELADARLTASQVLDLLAADPVRRRFGLDDGDLDRLRELAVGSGVRWGLDAAHRRPFKLESFGQNTWAAGLDRLLLGVAMSGDEQTWLGTAPARRRSSRGDTVRVGRLAEFVERLAGCSRSCRANGRWWSGRPRWPWGSTRSPPPSGTDAWQSGQARAELAEATHVAGTHAASVPLALADVRSLLAERLRGRPTRAGLPHRHADRVPRSCRCARCRTASSACSGSTTACSRARARDGDDVLARRPLVGERDPRSEDRQLLLDAVMAATETAGRRPTPGTDERTGLRRPPAVPLGELLDGGRRHRAGRRRRRPAPAAAVRRAQLRRGRAVQLRPGRAGRCPAPPGRDRARRTAPFLPDPAAPDRRPRRRARRPGRVLGAPGQGIPHPARGASLYEGDEAPPTRCRSRPTGSPRWAIGHRLLADRLAGRTSTVQAGRVAPRRACRRARLGEAVLDRVLEDVEPLVAAAAEVPGGARPPTGTSTWSCPTAPASSARWRPLRPRDLGVEYSRLAPKQRIRSWVRLVALTAATAEPWRAVTVGRGERFGIARATVGPLPRDRPARRASWSALRGWSGSTTAAARAAAALVDDLGHAYARRPPGRGGARRRAGERRGRGPRGPRAEHRSSPAGGSAGRAARRRSSRPSTGRAGDEPTRFGTLARRCGRPLSQAEDMVRR